MERTTSPGGKKKPAEPGCYPAGRFGEIGAPGYMIAPEGCPENKHRFKIGGVLEECVDLAICGFYCKKQCEKYLMFRRNARVRVSK